MSVENETKKSPLLYSNPRNMSDNTQVKYTQLGTSGLRVSVPIVRSLYFSMLQPNLRFFQLGAMSFGTPEWQPWVLDEEKSIEILKAAWDRGINTIDTANAYSNGESERVIGKFIKKVRPHSFLFPVTNCN